MDTALIATAEPQHAPALALSDPITPVVLTVQSLLRTRLDVATALHNAEFEIRCVVAWDRLPEAVERIQADIVLVDMDVVEQEAAQNGRLSGYRLVTLLARLLVRRPIALVVMTRLDFAEIEDLARAGISALIPPQAGARRLVQVIQAAMVRARERYRRGCICPAATVPVADVAATSDGAAQVQRMESIEVAQIAELVRGFTERLAVKQLAAPREEAAPPGKAIAPAVPQWRAKQRRSVRAGKATRGE